MTREEQKTALVTGGARGIGKATLAYRFAVNYLIYTMTH
jgi:NAD(P)-dependent dehydrogenase (short-subunit alcohol dehydrogenase family)